MKTDLLLVNFGLNILSTAWESKNVLMTEKVGLWYYNSMVELVFEIEWKDKLQ